jgi:hypothetical protein
LFNSFKGFTYYYKGTFPTRYGCFSKGDKAFFGKGGSVEQMFTTDMSGINKRIFCDEPNPDLSYTACMTEEECGTASLEQGFDDFRPGIWPSKGCFSKNGIAFFSIGFTEAMSTPTLPGTQERIWCGEASSLSFLSFSSQ